MPNEGGAHGGSGPTLLHLVRDGHQRSCQGLAQLVSLFERDDSGLDHLVALERHNNTLDNDASNACLLLYCFTRL